LDLGLPDGEGIEFLSMIRQSSKTPVLILTARDQEEEKIRLLEAGANDYLSKPFGIKELIVRIKVLLRDLVSEHFSEDIVTFSALKLQKSTHQCWLSDSEVILTKKEFAFLEMLMKTPGQLVKQTDLLREVWGHSHTADTHYLRILVSQLRKKLNDSADEQHTIKTESGLGYRLVTTGSIRD
ncbi:response regulator transcription factor, partial [Vibrio cholerae]|nr:response regulator transcription factor [Vibrio cholerae]